MKKIEQMAEMLHCAQKAKEGFNEYLINARKALTYFKKACDIEPNNQRYKDDYFNCLDKIKDSEEKIIKCDEMIETANKFIAANATVH